MRRGVSLVEVLVVVTILGILAAILFPVYTRAKESGYRAQSFADLRSLGHAQELYAGDNAGTYAVSEYTGLGVRWPDRLAPYVPGLAQMQAPLFTPGPGRLPQAVDSTVSLPIGDLGYALNACFSSRSGPGTFQDSARSVMFAETASFWSESPGTTRGYSTDELAAPDAVYASFVSTPAERWEHTGPYGSRKYAERGAYLFQDGHASIVSEKQFFVVPPRTDRFAICSQLRHKHPHPTGALLFAKETDEPPRPL